LIEAAGSVFERLLRWGVPGIVGVIASLAVADDGDPSLEVRRTEIIWEWSPYYTSVGALIPLTDAPPNVAGEDVSEFEVYRRLAESSLKPNVMLIEASVYPMPLLGTYLRREYPGSYERDDQHFRLIPALTSGFQEPWAVSAFFGNDMLFMRPGQPKKETNRGYMGFLVSYGDQHIKDNRLIDDDWLEVEWKMKGERIFEQDKLSWSFRVGTRYHRSPNIDNTVYFGISRSMLDFNAPLLSWLHNSEVKLMSEFLQTKGTFSRQEAIVGKKVPVRALKSAMQLDFGFIYERQAKYSGELLSSGRTGFTFIIRPNISF
jgi:hypothetical protein